MLGLSRRKLEFILLGNKGTGKTTFAKILADHPSDHIDPTKTITKYEGKIKLESSKKSSFLTLERYRKYRLSIIDVPGSFEDRRQWRDAFKKMKKPYAVCLVIDPYQSIPETQSTMEELYNRYLESISKDIEKADQIASQNPLLIAIIMNQFDSKGHFNEDRFFEDALQGTVEIIKKKIPLLLVDIIKVDLKSYPANHYEINAVLERIKRFYYNAYN